MEIETKCVGKSAYETNQAHGIAVTFCRRLTIVKRQPGRYHRNAGNIPRDQPPRGPPSTATSHADHFVPTRAHRIPSSGNGKNLAESVNAAHWFGNSGYPWHGAERGPYCAIKSNQRRRCLAARRVSRPFVVFLLSRDFARETSETRMTRKRRKTRYIKNKVFLLINKQHSLLSNIPRRLK
ncbi:Uncharacterized protein DBV15_06204 [Temnothorax longispinosus]|uniref:Uncharacterized protein n=1 Tax=Temnothorax longispinosus TaxID=300112 RepID=A0A4S2KJR7_9HYME|nr:Uncharacterized protein DBV15_06204 [Temnothorax longispinosus]